MLLKSLIQINEKMCQAKHVIEWPFNPLTIPYTDPQTARVFLQHLWTTSFWVEGGLNYWSISCSSCGAACKNEYPPESEASREV